MPRGRSGGCLPAKDKEPNRRHVKSGRWDRTCRSRNWIQTSRAAPCGGWLAYRRDRNWRSVSPLQTVGSTWLKKRKDTGGEKTGFKTGFAFSKMKYFTWALNIYVTWGIKTKTMKVYDSLNNVSINARSLTHFHLIYLWSEEFALRDGDECFQPSCLGLNKLPPLRTFFYPSREESGQKSKVSTATAKGHMDLDGPLFHRSGTKGDGELNHSAANKLDLFMMIL